jgi:hypothetical protein
MRDRLTFASAVLALLLVVFYIAPLDVLLLNAAEIEASPGGVVAPTWPVQLALLVAAAIVLLFSPVGILRRTACVCLSLAVLLYLQGNFFVWDYGPLDGTDIDWQAHDTAGYLEIVLWVGLPLLALRYARSIWPHVRVLALLILLLQVSSIGILLTSGKSFPRAPPQVARQIDESFFEFSADRNVLLVVLDTFASPMFNDIVEQHPGIPEALDGFINFEDTLGVSPYTLLSIPTILSSLVYENAGTIQSYMGDALGDRSLPSVLRDSGFRSDVVTMGTYRDYLRWLPGHDLTTVLYDGGADIERKAILQTWDLALFRYAPHFLKRRVYDRHRWLLQSLFLGRDGGTGYVDGSRVMAQTPVQTASRIVLDRLSNDASQKSASPTFKFIHLFTSHPPFLMHADGRLLTEAEYEATPMTERAVDQGAYALEQVLDILEKLQALGVYDETLVIVAADHGTDITKNTRPVYKRRAHPLLLVKPIGARGALQGSSVPASLLDIPATVSHSVGLDVGYDGYDLLAGDIPPDRERHYYYFNWEGKEFWNIDHLPFLRKYRVAGPVQELDSWSKACELPPVETRSGPCPEQAR